MKVLHLIDSGGLYGAEKVLLTLVKEQLRHGLEPMILSAGLPNEDKALEVEALRQGLPVTPWRMRPGLNMGEMNQIISWAAEERYELFHSHGYKFNILLGLVSRKNFNVPLVSTVHGYVRAKRFSKMWLYELVDRWALRRMDGIVLVSEAMQKEAASFEHKAVVIPNGLDADDICEAAKAVLEPAIEVFRSGHKPLIIGVGRLSAEKGFDQLVEAFALVKKRHPGAGLLILGEGGERHDLEVRIGNLGLKKSVLMPGYSEKVAACIRAADVLAMPSRTEGLPVTLLEAMAIGTPVVASAVGAIPQTLEEGRGGVLLDKVTPEALSDGISQAWEDSLEKRERIRCAMEQVRSRFSVQRMVTQYDAVYRRLSSKGRSPA